MEVSGRKVFCKPCEESELSTRADGLCRECKEHMCKICFDTHKKWKLNRGHTLINSDVTVAKKEKAEDLEKCDQHFSELIKFYCPQHEQVGRGDCMILEHKTCKVEYIPDKARVFKSSQEFKTMVQGAEKYLSEAKEISSSIKKNKKQALYINEKFLKDVNMFQEELISHVNKVTNAILKQGENIKMKDMKSMDVLEKENEDLIIEISRLTEMFETQNDQPQKLFVSSVLQRPKLNQLREQLDSIQGRNKIESYEFQRNNSLGRSVKDSKQLGSVQRIKPRNETDVKEEIKPKERTPPPQVPVVKKPQPLLDRQLICRNIAVDGEYLSYTDNGNGEISLYVDKKYVSIGSYFEVEILNIGQRGTIAIGLVPENYPENHLPGCGKRSIGYHANGLLYNGSGSGKKCGPKCNVGDRIGCGIINTLGSETEICHTEQDLLLLGCTQRVKK
ncbi:E3 ubiquitin-protein ligase TRIM33-like isoform X2 [Mercenaria mercenaria]|uniref:E3 ubiquitin-protein ligase TRIM33-like isoform X2 n=1 Tax=Mercenaria mercenaria TaxID=6596 RepID=UPI00234EE779|nr:E3 ubiquitin-protein ligase TRIM33-like isoform X2 [Mercenaria mercenaria]